MRHESACQHVRVLVGTGLGERLAVVGELGGPRLAVGAHDALVHRVGDGFGDIRVDGLMAVRLGHVKLGTGGVGDLLDGDGRAFDALRGDGRVHVRHGQRCGGHRTTDDQRGLIGAAVRGVVLQMHVHLLLGRLMEAHVLGGLRDGFEADDLRHGGLRGVVRVDQTVERGFRVSGRAAGVLHVPGIDAAEAGNVTV